MAQPYEIIASPYEVWLAPTGESFPATNATPGGNWVKLGTSGSRSYKDPPGVTVAHGETQEVFRGHGATGPQKTFRTEEDLRVRVEVADLTLEQYRYAVNSNTVTPDSGPPAVKYMRLYKGTSVTQHALLVRGASPYNDTLNMQFEVPVVVQAGTPEVVFQKGEPAGLALEFMAIEDPTASTDAERFGTLRAQTA